MMRRFRTLVGTLPFAKTLYGKYLAWLSAAKVSRGHTRLNILEAFPAFVANGWGRYGPRARLTVKSVNQTIPALLTLPQPESRSPLAEATVHDFAKGSESLPDVLRLKSLFDDHGSDKATRHDYHVAYARMLVAPERVAKVFEIGLGTNNPDVVSTMGRGARPGASLRAFRDYCPNAMVYGADFDRQILFQHDRIRTYYLDQTDANTFEAVGAAVGDDFDLMIDDGLHAPNANLHSLAFFLPRIRPGGWAVIEDISPASRAIWELVGRILPGQYECHLIRGRAALMFAVRRRDRSEVGSR